VLPVLSIFGRLETFIADDLYPYRYVITPLLVLAGLVLVAAAFRGGVHRVLWRHRTTSALVGAPLLVVAIVAGNYLLSPLWERSHLQEPSPLASFTESVADRVPMMKSTDASASMAQPRETHRGSFSGADDFHFGRGDALLIKTADGKNVLRFEAFSVRNGPDLYVYLSKDATGKKVEESLNLGRLKATDGAFNYEIPANIDLKDVKSVVVWCRQFSVQFAVALLQAR